MVLPMINASRLSILLVVALFSAASSAFAGTATATMTNTATVTGGCTISTTGFTASYDPVSANASLPLSSTINVSTTCTAGLPATVTLGQGANPAGGSTDTVPLRRLSNGATTYLNYTLSTNVTHTTAWGNTAGTGQTVTGLGTAVPLTGYAQIPGGQTGASVGTYTDTVVATVTF